MSNFIQKEPEELKGAFKREIDPYTYPATIPYFAHEAEVMRMEKQSKRLWIALVISILCILISILVWIWYINQYDFESYDYTQDGEGVNIIGDRNEVEKDGSKIQSEKTDEEEW